MLGVVLVALAAVLIATLPVLLTRTCRTLLNPAWLFLAIIIWSPLLKGIHLMYGPEIPLGELPGGETPGSFLLVGAALALLAVTAYTTAFLLVGRRTLPLERLGRLRHVLGRYDIGATAVLTLVSAGSFVVYLHVSGTQFFALPFSMKRFLPGDIGVETRFGYGPYYFFKGAMVSASVAFTAAFLLLRSEPGRDRAYRGLFAAAFTLALLIAHFASLRMFMLVLIVQIGLLVLFLGERRRLAFLSGFAVLTIASFAAITFVHRLPAAREATLDRTAVTATSARFGRGLFGGRYFLDLGKLSRLAHHFPSEHRYAMGRGYIGRLGPSGREGDGTALPGGMSRYVAAEVLGEPFNSVPPGYAGELYLNFGPAGLFLGFLLLGAFHRLLFTHLSAPGVSPAIGACLVLLIPTTTVVLMNSGLVAAVSRSLIDLGVFLCICPIWLRRRRNRGDHAQRSARASPRAS